MSRINTNIQSLVAQRVLHQNTNALNTSLHRLSTGYRINTGKDDPAGLIASEQLRVEKTAIAAALNNVSRANNVVASAEGGLDEISKLLLELEDLLGRSASETGIGVDERNANQLQIDAILDSINRIAHNTEFQGRKLLSGDLAYSTSGVAAATSHFDTVTINAAKVPVDGYRMVTVAVTGSAQLAQITWSGSKIDAGNTGGSVTLEVRGNLGSETLVFASGTAISDVAQAINQSRELTGVSAVASSDVGNGASGILLISRHYGSSQFVTVNVVADNGVNFNQNLSQGSKGDHTDYGQDASVTVNGIQAITDGLQAKMRSQALDVALDLTVSFGTMAEAELTKTFYITGGGATFMISPTISLMGSCSLGINAVSTGSLGNNIHGYLSSLATGQANQLSSQNYGTAQQIIRSAQDYVSNLRGRLGAFQKNTLETTANSLKITYENTAAAESTIRETDFASETSNLTRAQILVQSATSTLRLANAAPQTILALMS